MKKSKLKVALWATMTSVALMSVSCVKQPTPTPPTPPVDPKEVFDFAVTKSYTLDIKYDVEAGYRIGFDVYAENPFTVEADGRLVKNANIKPIDKGFVNDKGEYRNPILVPTYVNTIYIHSDYLGVNPRFLVAKIENGVLSKPVPAQYNGQPIVRETSKASGAVADLSANMQVGVEGILLKKPHQILSKWYQGTNASGGGLYTKLFHDTWGIRIIGRPVNMSYVDHAKFGVVEGTNNALDISPAIWNKIRSALPGDNGAPVEQKYLKNGDIHVTKNNTKLDLIFMDQQAAYRNALAYYCYPTNNPPKSADDIKNPVLAFPNAMVQKFEPALATSGDITSLYKGEGIKLKYVDENGAMHDEFPAGVSVGWILYRNGYTTFPPTMVNGKPLFAIKEGVGANYASVALTNGTPNTAVLRVGDFVVMGFDDGSPADSKRDYLDLVFHVKASPSDAITEEIPDVEEPEEEITYIEKSGTLAFEDLWPYQGDFDMNDVVVKYYSKISLNKSNQIVETEDTFTLLWCGATFKNGFSYTVDGVARANADVTFGAASTAKVDETFSDLTIHLFEDINKGTNGTEPSIVVKTKFKTPIAKASFNAAPYNSYIRINDGKNIGKETHLTNMKPINSEVSKWLSVGDDKSNPAQNLFFITFVENGDGSKQQLPFAINIIGTGNPATDMPYVISEEGKRIDTNYPKFINWINTKGQQDADWFMHPVKK